MLGNRTYFEKFCCSVREIEKSNVDSGQAIIDATKKCFHGFNLTENEQLSVVLNFFMSDSHNYSESDCKLPVLSCDTAPSTWHGAYFCLWVFLLIVTASSNATVITAVQTISYIRDHVGNFLLSSLAASDILVCLFIIPVRMKYAYNNLYFCSLNLCRLYVTTDAAFFSISITNLLFVALDRMMTLNYPYRYKAWLTSFKCKVVIVGIWIYGFTWGILSNINWNDLSSSPIQIKNHQCMVNNNSKYVASVYVIVFYIPALIMAFIYYQILVIAKYHAEVTNNNTIPKNHTFTDITSFDDPEEDTSFAIMTREIPSDERGERRYSSRLIAKLKQSKMLLRASKTAATVYGTFFICWFPVSVYSLSIAFDKVEHNEEKLKWFHIIFVEILPLLNSMMNPFLYAFMNRQYRRAFKIVLLKWKACLIAKFR